jgi:dodecin
VFLLPYFQFESSRGRRRRKSVAVERRPTQVLYGQSMSESVYNVIELIGTSAESWERATANAVAEAARTISDLRVARVIEQDVTVDQGQIVLYRSKVRLSFKHDNVIE